MVSQILSIDLGGTNTKMGVFSADFKLLAETSIPTAVSDGAKSAAEKWLKQILQWQKIYKLDLVGIGSPGPLDSESGQILESPNLPGWAHFSFTDFFRNHLQVPVYFENDANCAALGEWVFSKVPDLVMLTLGTGVGSGVISGGKLVRGVKGLGAEAGHMTIHFNGPECGCGKKGCLEAYVGGRKWVERYNAETESKIKDLNSFEIFNRAKNGEALAQKFVSEWTFALAVGIGNLVNIFNPSVVTLTGGMSKSFPFVENDLRKILVTQAFETSLNCVEVNVSKLQDKAGLYGAAAWAQLQNQVHK